jgi:hypothetical protein
VRDGGNAHGLVRGRDALVGESRAAEELDGLGVAALDDEWHAGVTKKAADAKEGDNDFVAMVISGDVGDDDSEGNLEVPARIQNDKISVEYFFGLALFENERPKRENPEIQQQESVETQNGKAWPRLKHVQSGASVTRRVPRIDRDECA